MILSPTPTVINKQTHTHTRDSLAGIYDESKPDCLELVTCDQVSHYAECGARLVCAEAVGSVRSSSANEQYASEWLSLLSLALTIRSSKKL